MSDIYNLEYGDMRKVKNMVNQQAATTGKVLNPSTTDEYLQSLLASRWKNRALDQDAAYKQEYLDYLKDRDEENRKAAKAAQKAAAISNIGSQAFNLGAGYYMNKSLMTAAAKQKFISEQALQGIDPATAAATWDKSMATQPGFFDSVTGKMSEIGNDITGGIKTAWNNITGKPPATDVGQGAVSLGGQAPTNSPIGVASNAPVTPSTTGGVSMPQAGVSQQAVSGISGNALPMTQPSLNVVGDFANPQLLTQSAVPGMAGLNTVSSSMLPAETLSLQGFEQFAPATGIATETIGQTGTQALGDVSGQMATGQLAGALSTAFVGGIISTTVGFGVGKMLEGLGVGAKTSGFISGAAGGAAAGAYMGSVIPGVGTLVGAVVGGVIGAISSLFGSWICTAVDYYVGMTDEEKVAMSSLKGYAKEHYPGWLKFYVTNGNDLIDAIEVAEDNPKEYFTKVKEELVDPCVSLIYNGELGLAFEMYKDYATKMFQTYMPELEIKEMNDAE